MASWLLVLIACISPLISPHFNMLTAGFGAYALLCFVLLYSGLLLSSAVHVARPAAMSVDTLQFLMRLLLAVGVGSRLVDRLVLRPAGDLFSISAVRDSRVADSNVASVIGALAPAFGLVLFALLRHRMDRRSLWFGRAMGSLYVLDLLLTGSRGIVLIALILLLGLEVSKRTLAVVVPLLIVGSGALFLVRFMSITGSSDSLEVAINSSQLGYARYVPASESSLSILQGQFGARYFFPILQLNQYAAHALFEFSELYRAAPQFTFAPGELLPQLPFFPRQDGFVFYENLYYTLPGTLTLAFGKIGAPIAALVIGVCLGRVAAWAISDGGGAKTVVILAVFGVPFVNTVGGFDFIFFLAAIWIFARVMPSAEDGSAGPGRTSAGRVGVARRS